MEVARGNGNVHWTSHMMMMMIMMPHDNQATATGNMHVKSAVKFEHVVFEICSLSVTQLVASGGGRVKRGR